MDMIFQNRETDFCYIDCENNNIIINYSKLKQIIEPQNYAFIKNIIINVFNDFLKIRKTIEVHINLKGLNLTDIDKNYDYLCYLVNILKTQYPDKLEICYVYDCPSIFGTLFKIISAIIDKKTQEKIKIVN